MLSIRISTFVLLLLAPPAPSTARSLVVIDAADLPEKLPNTHERLRQAVEGAAAAKGWDIRPMPESSCDQCFEQTAATAGVGTILRVTGRKTSSGYDIAIELWSALGESRRTTGICEDCLFDGAMSLAARLTREILASHDVTPQLSAAPPATVPIATAIDITAPQPQPLAPKRHLLAPLLVGGAGVVALITGISLWALDGASSTTCTNAPATGSPNCNVYATKTSGEVLTGFGAIGVVTGAVLLYRTFSASDSRMGISVGPGAAALVGSF